MGRRPAKVLELDMPFEEALERFIRVDPLELLGRSLRSPKLAAEETKRRKNVPNAKKPSPSKGQKNARNAQPGTRKKGTKS